MSYRKNSTPSGGGSTKKYAVVNTSIFKPPPSTQHANQQGKLLVLHRPTTKNTAPAPINTSSLRRENNGKDTTIALVPVGQTTVWGGGNKTTEESSKEETEQQPAQVSSKPAPWAKSETPEVSTTPQVVAPKMQSWAASDSEDSDDDTPAPVPVPGYLTSPLNSSPSSLPPPPSTHATTSPSVPAQTSSSTVSNPVIRRNLADITGDYSGRPSYGRDRERGDSRDRDMGPYSRGDGRGDGRGDYRSQQPPYGHRDHHSQSGGWNRHSHESDRDRYGPGGRYSGGYGRDRSDSWGRNESRSGVAGIVTVPGVIRGSNEHDRHSSANGPANVVGSLGSGPKIDSGMSEEQKALERARYEREQLEFRKRQLEVEESRRREEEERAREMEERRQQERHDRERDRERESRFREQPDQGGGGRWERAPMPSAAPSRPSPRGHRQGYGDYHRDGYRQDNSPREYRPRLYSGEGDRDRDRDSGKDRSYSIDSSGSRGSRGSDRERYQSNVSNANAFPHHLQHDVPTRILKPPSQQKKLFDSKSGNFIVQKEKDTSSSAAPKTIWGAKTAQASSSRDAPESAQQIRDKQREARVQEMNALAMEEQRKRDEKQAAKKEARAKERAERQPRTKGVLYRFISAEEAEDMSEKAVETGSSAYEVHKVHDKLLARVLSVVEEKQLAERDAQDQKDDARKAKKLLREQKLAAKKLRQAKEKEASKLGHNLDALTVEDEDVLGDILQESVEFQEVKSKRTVAQEKKLIEPGTESSPGPRERKEGRTGKTGVGSSQSSAASSPAPPASSSSTTTTATTSTQPPATIPPPAQPAWIGTGDTFKAIGVPVPEVEVEKAKKGKHAKDKEKDKEPRERRASMNEKLKKDKEGRESQQSSTPNSSKKNVQKAEREARKGKRASSEQQVENQEPQKDSPPSPSSSFDVTEATRHLLAPPQQLHHSTTDILDMSAEIDQQDLTQNMRATYSRFVPGVGLTGDVDEDAGRRNSPSPSRSNDGINVGSDTGNLEALMGLGNTAPVSSFDSAVSWQFNTNADDEDRPFRSHANSNVSDDENAYTHHTEALTQLTEGDDDHDLPYSGHALTPPVAVTSGEVDEKSSGDGNDEEEDKPDRENGPRGRGGKVRGSRGGKGRGGRESKTTRGSRGGRGGARGPPAVSDGNVVKANSARAASTHGDKAPTSGKKFFKDKDKESGSQSADTGTKNSGTSVSRKKITNDKSAPQQQDRGGAGNGPPTVAGGAPGRGGGRGGGKGSAFGGRTGGKGSGGKGSGGGKGRGGGRGGGGKGSNPRGPPAVSA